MSRDDTAGPEDNHWNARLNMAGCNSAGCSVSLDDDRLHEECGVFGIFARQDAAALTALGLHALQHRGQEAAGIVTCNGTHFPAEKRPGLVSDHFNRKDVIERLKGNSAIGHVRYSTTGGTILRNIQPLYADLHNRGFAICHNGNLTNAVSIREEIIKSGAICQSTSDTEVVLHLVARSSKRTFVEKFIDALGQIEGAYAFVGLTNDMLIGARDPLGIRPLILGDLEGAPVLASETCALDIIGAKFVREVENGEVIVISENGIQSHRPFPPRKSRPCIFEYIYFSRPDSVVNGRSIYDYRKQMGADEYAFVGLTNDMLIGARDPLGIRPLILGDLEGAPVLASETCALDIIGAKFVREVENGEVIVISENGIQSHRPFPPRKSRPCIFEYIYFSRPDSVVNGRSIYDYRKQMGAELAREAPVEVDVIVPIPDSGVPAAIGFAQELNTPFELGIIRNHYVGRTFIEPEQKIRQLGVKLKHSANRSVIDGKRVVLVDDSVVRGTTSVKIVQMIYEAGAREVHMRISSPAIIYPDFYGIDTPDQEKLLAAMYSNKGESALDLESMRDFMGASSLAFLSVNGVYRAMGQDGRDDSSPQYTDHCFTGDYPTALKDREKLAVGKELSLLAEAG